MDVASSSRQPMSAASTPLQRPSNIDTNVLPNSPSKGQASRDFNDSVPSSPISTQSRDSVDTAGISEEEPLMQQSPQSREEGDPPPAYSPSAPNITSSPLATDRMPLRRDEQPSYGTTTESRTYYTFPHAAPEAPGEAPSDPLAPLFGVRRRLKRRRCYPWGWKQSTRKRVYGVIGWLVATMLILLILWQLFKGIRDAYHKEPNMIPWFECANAEVIRTESFDFHDFSTFTLQERLASELMSSSDFGGKVQVVESSPKQDSAVRVNIEMRSTYLTYLQRIDFKPGTNKLIITSPKPPAGKDPLHGERACTAMNIVISVNSRLSDSLEVDTALLSGVELDRNLALASNNLIIHTVGGDIAKTPGKLTGFRPYHIDLFTVAGAIRGAFPLEGETWLATVGGPIDVAVALPPQDILNPEIHFHANSEHGDVHITFPTQELHEHAHRQPEYYVQASSVHGRISGTYIHHAETNLTTVSGDIEATLVPHARVPRDMSTIHTASVIGQTILTIEASNLAGDLERPMRQIYSTHNSVMGGMRLRYPGDWEGTIHGEWVPPFGQVDVAGPGLEKLRSKDGAVEAQRGSGKSMLSVETVSGVCEILIGE